MKRLALLALTAGSVLSPLDATAANVKVEITLEALNELVGDVGTISDSGTFQPRATLLYPDLTDCVPIGSVSCAEDSAKRGKSAVPLVACHSWGGGLSILPSMPEISWSWWITRPRLGMASGSLTFSAAVLTRVDDKMVTTRRSVPASLTFDRTSQTVGLHVGTFRVPVQVKLGSKNFTLATVEVDKRVKALLSLRPPVFTVPLGQFGGSKSLEAELVAMLSVTAVGDLVRLEFDVGVSEQ